MKTAVRKRNRAAMIPVILALGFVPLIVHQYEYHTHLSVFDWFPDASEVAVDFFLAYKSFAIMILGAVMLLFLIREYQRKKKLSFEPVCYLLIAYAALVLCSGLASGYRAYAFRGGYEIFEPVWVVLSYVVFAYYTYHFVQDEGQVLFVLHWAGTGWMLVTLIGLFQYAGKDFFKTDIGKMLITDPSYWNRLDQITFTFPEGWVYTTLYNVDFLSFFFGMLIPVLLATAFAVGRWWQKPLYLMAAAASAICLKGAKTDSGYLALGAAVAVSLWILMSRRRWSGILACVLYVILAFLLLRALTGTEAGERLKKNIVGTVRWSDAYVVKGMETGGDCVRFFLEDKELCVSYVLDTEQGTIGMTASDGEGCSLQLIAPEEPAGVYVLDSEAYGECTIQAVDFGEYYGIAVKLGGKTWHFTKQIDGTYYYFNPFGKFVKLEEEASADCFHDDAFHKRGMLWNRTIPLLKKYLVLGIGANNFVLAYPQGNYIYRAYQWASGVDSTLDVKAHCWLLQQWVENGLPAVLCLLAFYGWYFIRSVRIYRRADLRRGVTRIGFGILTGTLTYMIVSIANDSNVCTAPMFWIMMGLGMAVNRMVEREQGLFRTELKERKGEKGGKAGDGRAV